MDIEKTYFPAGNRLAKGKGLKWPAVAEKRKVTLGAKFKKGQDGQDQKSETGEKSEK